jgi:hypothetical protein
MTAKNFIQTCFEHFETEVAVAANSERLVIDGQVWLLRGVEPDAALLRGQWNLGADGAGYNLVYRRLSGRSTETLLEEAAFRIGQTVDTDIRAWTVIFANCHINDCRSEQRICRGGRAI